MLKRLEHYIQDVARGRKKGLCAGLLRGFLRVLSWLFRCLVSCRNWAFDHGWFRRYYPPVPVVISVGNIVAGGTGKTPVTLMIAKEFCGKYPLAILSRGYRSPAEKLLEPLLLSKGEGPLHQAHYCGDEPYLLAKNLPDAFVYVGKDRHKASNMAAKAGAELILLDDGMQHRRLARDFEVVVMDARDPVGQGYFLPRGLLREGLSSLSRADLIICNNVHDLGDYTELKKNIMKYTSAPVVAVRPEAEHIWDMKGSQFNNMKGLKVGIFCGIAQPEHFQLMVKKLGAQVVACHFVGDHMRLEPDELERFAKTGFERGAQALVCTEKDKVKLEGGLDLPLPVLWIQMRLKMIEGDASWKAFINKAKEKLH